MALDPSAKYPGQVFTSEPGYPLGAARNRATAADTNGTPLERDWVNDLWGFQQALLDAGGLTADGNPDRVGASQYLTALQSVVADAVDDDKPILHAMPLIPVDTPSDTFVITTDVSLNVSTVLRQTAITGFFDLVTFNFVLPYSGMRIKANGLRVFVKGASGHSALPVVMPSVVLARRQANQSAIGTPVTLVEGTDASGSTGSYQVSHLIVPSLSALNFSPSDQFTLRFRGESGTNAIVGLDLQGVLLQLEPVP